MCICKLCLLLFILSVTVSFGQLSAHQPSSTTNHIIEHSCYWFSYSEPHEQPEWVYYLLTKERVSGTAKRKNNFRSDPKVETGSASLADYKGSGYDRGHLCAAADNTHSVEAMSESFYMSNMSPQAPSFNRGIWKRLEGQFRKWTSIKDSLYVVTGGVLTSAIDTIGGNQVTVPKYYYKIALHVGADTTAIGFLMPNEASKQPLLDYVVSIDSIEVITGIDFFYQTDNQEKFEGAVKIESWVFK